MNWSLCTCQTMKHNGFTELTACRTLRAKVSLVRGTCLLHVTNILQAWYSDREALD
jgi:hypothetical protein